MMYKLLFNLVFLQFFAYNLFGNSNFIYPLPIKLEYDIQKASLGERLFFDTILSADGTVSCFSCHNVFLNGADDSVTAVGINGSIGKVNTPTVFNAIFNFRQNWNGSARNLSQQAFGPITNPLEMGHNFKELVEILSKSDYKKLFNNIYSNGITKENIVDAIAEFQKQLITPNAPFDRYLNGDENAISQTQKDGYRLFKSKGCISCHNGINIGGQLFSRFGMVSLVNDSNLGLYEVTKEEEDKFYFKVPSLRNVALTAPYFHDGSAITLHDAVSIMLKYQVGRDTTKEEIDKIVDFLHSLNGEITYAKK